MIWIFFNMACPYPLKIKNKKFSKDFPAINWNVEFFRVPCGYCLNCRVDKRNYLEFECFQEFKKFKFFGAFVTLTYDDASLLHCLRKDKEGNLAASLVHKDIQDFLKRLRSNLDYFHKKNPNKCDSVLCSKDFKVLYVGEYGENGSVFDRPHWHLLFFGLDFALCEKLISSAWRDTWNNSLCDVKPILAGGIRYVLKYCDKQLFGEQAKVKYDDNNLERPKMRRSRYFAFDYYVENKKYILANNCCVDWTKGSKLPVRSYIKNKILGVFKPDFNILRNVYKDCYNLGLDGHFITLQELNSFRRQKSLLREKDLIAKSRRDLKPVPDIRNDYQDLDDFYYDSDSINPDYLFIELYEKTGECFCHSPDWFDRQYWRLHTSDYSDVIPF